MRKTLRGRNSSADEKPLKTCRTHHFHVKFQDVPRVLATADRFAFWVGTNLCKRLLASNHACSFAHPRASRARRCLQEDRSSLGATRRNGKCSNDHGSNCDRNTNTNSDTNADTVIEREAHPDDFTHRQWTRRARTGSMSHGERLSGTRIAMRSIGRSERAWILP
jgi:hypothetical protein